MLVGRRGNTPLDRDPDTSSRHREQCHSLQSAMALDNEEDFRTILTPGTIHSREELVVVAARQGSSKILKTLIGAGVAADREDNFNRTALMYASQGFHEGHVECTKLLLQAGSDVNIRDSHGENALMLSCRLGRMSAINLLLATGKCDVNVVNSVGHTALHIAIESGHREAVPLLLSHGAEADTQDNVGGTTPLMSAARDGDAETMRALLQANADPNRRRKNGMAAIHVATLNPNIDILVVQELLQTALNVNIFDAFQMLPINYAAKNKRGDIVSDLVKANSYVNPPDPSHRRWTPLHFAVVNSSYEQVSSLLEAGADTDAYSSDSITPLDLAVSEDRPDIVSAMLDYNCSLRRRHPTRKGHAPIIIAATSGHIHLLWLLHWAGADIAPEELRRCVASHNQYLPKGSLGYLAQNSDALQNVINLITQPRTLMDLCRITIRVRLGKSLHEKLPPLKLPSILKAYISLNNH